MIRPAQTRVQSLAEALVSVAIGYAIALVAQLVILPCWGIRVPMSTHLGIPACFTGLSVARTYVVRRVFEGRNR